MLYLFAQDSPVPSSPFEVILWPLVAAIAAVAVFAFGVYLESRDMKASWKWIAVVGVVVSLYFAIRLVMQFQDPFYNSMVTAGAKKKMIAAHYGSLALPFIAMGAIIWMHLNRSRIDFDRQR